MFYVVVKIECIAIIISVTFRVFWTIIKALWNKTLLQLGPFFIIRVSDKRKRYLSKNGEGLWVISY